ncbi:MAG: glycoside hydrolase family 92 protein, partial [Armatimonadota bacterium]|nr:glycoside hydrolase family 92 protein [Armatimonadota bacterium]
AGTYIDNTGPTPTVQRIPCDGAGQPRYRHFNSDAFWGAQWSITPLWSLAYPEVVEQFCSCFLDIYRNGGLIPRGPSGGNYTFVMTSAQTTPLYVSAIHQGIARFADLEEVYQALRKNHFPAGLMSKCGYEHDTCRGGGIEDYMALGYIPEDLPPVGFHNNGAAQTLEHAYNDWCLSQLARTLGKEEDARLFAARSHYYRNLFDVEIGFMRPRNRDGSWLEPYDPYDKRGWTEANGWTYTFYVPHDVPDLIRCFGSAEHFFARLEECLSLAEQGRFVAPHDRHYENTLDFGNEPALAVAHLFHVAGRPARTQYWLRRIFDTLKSGNSPRDGYGGDEDQGMMGAWNALVAMGLFSVDGACGVTPLYQVTTPIFDRITIHRDARYGPGGSFTIEAIGNRPGVPGYLHSAELDGTPLERLELTFAQIASGERLVLRVGPEPPE